MSARLVHVSKPLHKHVFKDAAGVEHEFLFVNTKRDPLTGRRDGVTFRRYPRIRTADGNIVDRRDFRAIDNSKALRSFS